MTPVPWFEIHAKRSPPRRTVSALLARSRIISIVVQLLVSRSRHQDGGMIEGIHAKSEPEKRVSSVPVSRLPTKLLLVVPEVSQRPIDDPANLLLHLVGVPSVLRECHPAGVDPLTDHLIDVA